MTVIARSGACEYCEKALQLTDEPDARWTSSMGWGTSGQTPECPEAPNPDDGPMPGHKPTVIAYRPEPAPEPEWINPDDIPAPVIPWIPQTNPRTEVER